MSAFGTKALVPVNNLNNTLSNLKETNKIKNNSVNA